MWIKFTNLLNIPLNLRLLAQIYRYIISRSFVHTTANTNNTDCESIKHCRIDQINLHIHRINKLVLIRKCMLIYA